MTKRKHPQDRAERLRINEEKNSRKKGVQKNIIEEVPGRPSDSVHIVDG